MADATGKLPVLETVSKAFGYTAGNLSLVIKIVWPWVPIMAGALIVFVMGLAAVGGTSSPGTGQGASAPNVTLMIAGGLVYFIAVSTAMASMAVEWHRALLLGETVGWMHFRLRSRTFAYFGYLLAIGLATLPPTAILIGVLSPFTAFPASGGEGLGRLALVTLAAALFATLLMSRLFLVLPGAAVGDRRISFRQSIALTKGHTLPIFGGFLILTLIGFGLGLISVTVEAMVVSAPVAGFIFSLLTTLVNAFLTFVGLSYMSFCYWFLVPSPQEGDLA